jgi:hypothetical protein
MGFITFADGPRYPTFKVEVARFRDFSDSSGKWLQCKWCGTLIEVKPHSTASEMEEAQRLHDCSHPKPLHLPAVRREPRIQATAERRISFEGIPPR